MTEGKEIELEERMWEGGLMDRGESEIKRVKRIEGRGGEGDEGRMRGGAQVSGRSERNAR